MDSSVFLYFVLFTIGGVLFVAALYTTEDGQYPGAAACGKNLFETMHNAWKQLHQEGNITKVGGSFILFACLVISYMQLKNKSNNISLHSGNAKTYHYSMYTETKRYKGIPSLLDSTPTRLVV